MPRKQYGRHKKVVTGTQDATKQVSKDEWNDDLDSTGLLGFTVSTVTLVTDKLSPTDTFTKVDGEGGAADNLSFINFGAANVDVKEYDIIAILKGAQTITVKHNTASPPANSGPIILLGSVDKLADTNIPIWLQLRGTSFFEIRPSNIWSSGSILAKDENGNEIIKVAYVASAVNEIQVTNAATGNRPKLESTGGDTNIGLDITGKGTGNVNVEKGDLNATKRLLNDITTLTFAATTDIDFNDNEVKSLSLTGNITFTTSNRATGKNKTIKILCDGTQRTFTFPAGWKFMGQAAPANIAINKTAILTLTCFGSADADIVAAYAVEP